MSDPNDSWMNTYSGIHFTPFKPKPQDILIEDIAHALSHQCRFGGHCKELYFVSEHCIHVSAIVKHLGGTLDEQRFGVLHDASEAYIGDVITPLKRHPDMSFYHKTEATLEAAIAERFHLLPKMPPLVKHADSQMLHFETRRLTNKMLPGWGLEPFNEELEGLIDIFPMNPGNAKAAFLKRFYELFPEEKV